MGQRHGHHGVVVALILFGLPLTGCSLPTGRFDAFATANRSLRSSTEDTYTKILKLQRRYMVFNPAPGTYTENTFKPVVVGSDGTPKADAAGKPLDFDFAPRLAFRESALDVLSAYADVLVALAKRDVQKDLDAASQDLAASLKKLAPHMDKPDDATQAAGLLVTAVNEAGRLYVQWVQRSALRKAMTMAQPGVEQLADLIADDNTKISRAVAVMRMGILRSANHVRPPASVDRLRFDADMATLLDEIEQILRSLEVLNTAVAAIPKAHAEIRNAMDAPETPLAQLQGLIAEAKRVSAFYRTTK